MRHGSSGRRGRHRGNGGGGNGGHRRGGSGGGNPRMQVFDSNGPEVRIRGTAYQICEKYQALAKDAASMGDRILAESYLQHAEHYQRLINSWGEAYAPREAAPAVDSGMDQPAGDDLGLPASIVTRTEVQKSPEFETA